MKKKLSPQELERLRKQQAHRKEMEYLLKRDLTLESERRKTEELFYKDKNPLVIGGINFVFTIIFGYAIKFIITRFVPFSSMFDPVFNVLIWGSAIVSAFLKKSLIERLFDRINP